MRLAAGMVLAAAGLGLIACGGGSKLPPASTGDDAGLIPGPDAEEAAPPPDADVAALPDAGEPPDAASDPDQPPPGFLVPTSPDYLTLDFKVLINSQDTVYNDSSNIITGMGHAEFKFGDRVVKLSTSDNLYAYDYGYPSDYPDPKLAGTHYLILSGSVSSDDSTSTKGSSQAFQVSFSTTSAQALASDEHLLTDTVARATLMGQDYVVRKDSSMLYKVCYEGMTGAGSAIFLDHSANKDFAVGENLIAWANAVEVTDTQALFTRLGARVTSYQGQPCTCYLDSATFDCATWDQEIAKDGSELSCNPPADFLAPPTGVDYAIFKYKGSIEAGDNPSPKPGFAPGTISIAGAPTFTAASGYAFGFNSGGSDLVQLSLYDAGTGDAKQFSYNEFTVTLDASGLVQAKSDGTDPIGLDASPIGWALAQKLSGYSTKTGYLYRLCPFAVFRPGETAGKLYDCPAANTAFVAGEGLEIEGSLVLQKNITEADIGTPLGADGCYCTDATNAVVDCSTLPAL